MEVRVIKTCQGFETLRFLDGALVPMDGRISELCEARKRQVERELWAMMDEDVKNYVPMEFK